MRLYRFIFVELFIPKVLLPAPTPPIHSPLTWFQAAVNTPSPSRWITPLPHAPQGTHSHPSSSVRRSLPFGSYPLSALLPSTVKRITIWFSFFSPFPLLTFFLSPCLFLSSRKQHLPPCIIFLFPDPSPPPFPFNCRVFMCWNYLRTTRSW